MESLPEKLTVESCPLLEKHGGGAADLVTLYNLIRDQLEALSKDPELSGLLRGAEFRKDIVDKLREIRNELNRSRYTVGFIGLSQAGKSTSVNNILGDQEVCKSGSGVATSSQPARLIYAPRRSLDVFYLTSEDFRRRRQKLAGEIGLPSPGEDGELLEILKNDERFKEVFDKPRLKKDREFLAQFIQASHRHTDYLTPTGKSQVGLPFEDRLKYTTHSREGGPNQTLLLKEAVFHLDLPTIPTELEICDLPGLGSERSIDDIVTFEYLPDLNGTLLFVNAAMNLKDVSLTDAINRVRKTFEGDISGRAWIVFTKLDSLTDNYFRPGTDNIFAGVLDILRDQQIPASQVCFVSNELHKELVDEPADSRKGYAAKRLKQSATKPIPETCPPELQPAWEALLADGGIGRVRGLITEDVGRSLAGQIRTDSLKKLNRLRIDVEHRIQTEKTRRAGGTLLYEKVVTCQAGVDSILDSLRTQPTAFKMLQQSEEFHQRLRQFLDRPEMLQVLANADATKLPEYFQTHTRMLSQLFRNELVSRIVEPTYQEIRTRLEGFPAVSINGFNDCAEAWEQYQNEDRAIEAWASGQLPEFASDEMYQWFDSAAKSENASDGAIYQSILKSKIQASIHQAMHVLRSRLRARLQELDQELNRLTKPS